MTTVQIFPCLWTPLETPKLPTMFFFSHSLIFMGIPWEIFHLYSSRSPIDYRCLFPSFWLLTPPSRVLLSAATFLALVGSAGLSMQIH